MFFSVRSNFLLAIILFSVLSGAVTGQAVSGSDEMPSLLRIIINSDSVLLIPSDTKEKDIFFKKTFVLDYRNNNIAFELTKGDSFEYQYFLIGFDRNYTSWGHNNYKEYTNLPAGRYQFKVRFISSGNIAGEMSLLAIKVLPLWYFSG